MRAKIPNFPQFRLKLQRHAGLSQPKEDCMSNRSWGADSLGREGGNRRRRGERGRWVIGLDSSSFSTPPPPFFDQWKNLTEEEREVSSLGVLEDDPRLILCTCIRLIRWGGGCFFSPHSRRKNPNVWTASVFPPPSCCSWTKPNYTGAWGENWYSIPPPRSLLPPFFF